MAASENEDRKTDDQETEVSLDMSQAQIKRMIAEARERGYITYDQLNNVLPPDQVSSEQIEDVMSMLAATPVEAVSTDPILSLPSTVRSPPSLPFLEIMRSAPSTSESTLV